MQMTKKSIASFTFYFPFVGFNRIGFVTQDDVLFPQLTVEETLVFSAFLRLPSSMSPKEKYERVEMIVKELNLERYTFSMKEFSRDISL